MRIATARMPGMLLTDHQFSVPIDHDDPDAGVLSVFAREVVAWRKRDDDLPWLLYLQGGPGHRSPRPVDRSGWLGRALVDHRVLLLDQRGTGRSTPATRQTLAGQGSPQEQAHYLTHFRADSIVRDAELVRGELLGDRRWTLLGQSFGGFCALTYLSLAPDGVAQAIITGGLPPLEAGPDDVYRATYERVLDRTGHFLDRYPADGEVLDEVADVLEKYAVRLPSGAPFRVERLQQLGILLGQHDGFEQLHYLLETAFINGCGGRQLSDEFLAGVERDTTFRANPLYALLHEAIYCGGTLGGPSGWSAQRVRETFPDLAPESRPLRLTGEMVYPWMFEGDQALEPLREVAELLAGHGAWGSLYDPERLAANTVPIAAAIYHDDMYVEYAYSIETARRVANLRYWVTNEYSHDGLRSDVRVLDRLFDLVEGEA
jgi:pimeloyl-ACP methyl ester carboxylesterase